MRFFRAPIWCPSGGWLHARGREHCLSRSLVVLYRVGTHQIRQRYMKLVPFASDAQLARGNWQASACETRGVWVVSGIIGRTIFHFQHCKPCLMVSFTKLIPVQTLLAILCIGNKSHIVSSHIVFKAQHIVDVGSLRWPLLNSTENCRVVGLVG